MTNVLSLLGVDIETAYGTGTGTAPVWGGVRHVNIADVAWDVLGKFDRNIGAFFAANRRAGTAGLCRNWPKSRTTGANLSKATVGIVLRRVLTITQTLTSRPAVTLLMNEKVTKGAWLAFYAKAGKTSKLGALPFRIAQVYKSMCDSLTPSSFIERPRQMRIYAIGVPRYVQGSEALPHSKTCA